jgi:hypothetical protein
MYLNALEREVIPDTETMSLNYPSDRVRWPSSHEIIKVVSQEAILAIFYLL